ncbi:Spectrin beta chain, non-erythrocytic 5 [Liparis tanakae]|uniref:Spectrin beta chain, non-erythrocytic 5 n=1 Tax=Liparis tanakae TaxID=230148 RepID=A0A4Z2G231_9TELE|nr:Spectrin beta chain, non-erythrocytic 5 [Liparis tanakae]
MMNVSPSRGQRLKEVLHLHEFRRESSEFEDWMDQQRQTAESQDLGNDYQHVQVLRGKFEGFLTQLEAGEERLQSCSGLAAPLIRNKHLQSSAVREMLQQLSACWEHLRGVARERQDQLQKAEECSYDFNPEQLDTVDIILDLCTPQLKLRLQEVQQEVVERWEELRLHAEQWEEELKLACQRYMFLNTAQDYFLWCGQLIGAMAAEESIRDVATADLQLAQHQQLWAEMEARQETYQQALDMGEQLQAQDANRKEVTEKLEALQEERGRLEEQWNHKHSWLQSVHLEQVFYRDADSLDKTCSSQEELAERLKEQLSGQKSGRVQARLKALLQRRDRIKELSVKRREQLELSRMLSVFNRDVAEVTDRPLSILLSR